MITKWCGICGYANEYDESASYCTQCGKRSLDYRCLCGRLHAGGMPCHCEPIDTKYPTMYDTVNLHGLTIKEFTTGKK